MAASANPIPKEIYYQFVRKPQSMDELIASIYPNPSADTIAHFKAINGHLKNNVVKVGQLVIITPPGSQQCSRYEADLAQAAALVDQKLANLSTEEARILAEHYQLLSSITEYGGAGYGATLVYFNQHLKNIDGILDKIARLYTQTYNSTGGLNGPKFYANRRALFLQLEMTLRTFAGHAKVGFDFDQSGIKSGLGLNTRSILHQWKSQPGPVTTVPGFAKNFARVTKLSNTLKRAGYVGIALDGTQSAIKIHEACTVGTDKQCTRTSFREGGRFAGSVGLGTAGGIAASYLTCNVVFGIETVGTSLLWCGIVAGMAGGYVGGQAGSAVGSVIGNKAAVQYERLHGDVLYATTVR